MLKEHSAESLRLPDGSATSAASALIGTLLFCSLLVLACGSGPEVPPGNTGTTSVAPRDAAVRAPIVLITLSGLRPDAVGALGASPAIFYSHDRGR